MNLTRLEKAVVQRKFIRYCIKVLDGEALNYLDEMDKIWEREINFSELREGILDGFCSYDEFMEIRYFQIWVWKCLLRMKQSVKHCTVCRKRNGG